MHWEEVWTDRTWRARLLRGLLLPASWLYAAGWQSYLALYRYGLKAPKQPHRPILCVGNLQVGGTGKTPIVVHLADVLRELGHEVVISCSGYGSAAAEAAALAPSGPLLACEWGDEASLLRRLRPATPIVVGRRRVLAAQLCRERFPGAVLVMDDGFQHLPLKKDVTILSDPPTPNAFCLPAGPYREPRANRNRADLVLPGDFRVEEAPLEFETPAGAWRTLAGDVQVLCGLGRPKRFLDSLAAAGLSLTGVRLLPDHDPLSSPTLLAGFDPRVPLVVTGKDWVKLRERPDVEGFDIAIARHEIHIVPPDRFRDWLQKILNGIPKKTV